MDNQNSNYKKIRSFPVKFSYTYSVTNGVKYFTNSWVPGIVHLGYSIVHCIGIVGDISV